MPETICQASEPQDAVKTELSSPPVLATCDWDTTALKSDSPTQSLESKPSPNQDEHELIDITTVKAEDSNDIITDIHTNSNNINKTEIGTSKNIDACTSNKNEDGGNIDVGGEKIRAHQFDSDSMQSSSNSESNIHQPNASTVEHTNIAQSDLENSAVDNQESICPSSTTNFEEIQNQLKKTLDHIEQRHMVSGFRTLSNATNAVVEHCEQLGLTSDDHPYNAIDREQFWAGLNNCWLYALAQRQEPSSTEEKMTDQQLCSLRERVVTWADKLERYGLVDYEMGWWEADILAAMDAILATNYASAQAVAQAAVAKAAVALFGDEACG